jgi:DNA-binding Lrp family transcriptional regulator
MELDATDRRILSALQREGRITNAELSERVNLSPSACHRRVQRLEQEGYLTGYVALVDARRLGRPTTVFVEITLQSQADELLDAFEREVRRVPEVLECHLMAGTADYRGADAFELLAENGAADDGAAGLGMRAVLAIDREQVEFARRAWPRMGDARHAGPRRLCPGRPTPPWIPGAARAMTPTGTGHGGLGCAATADSRQAQQAGPAVQPLSPVSSRRPSRLAS